MRTSRRRETTPGGPTGGGRARSGFSRLLAGRDPGAIFSILIALPVVLPLLPAGWFLGHDNMHLLRLFEQDVMVRAGEIPVRWYPDVAAGYGSPHPQYYAPLFYLAAQVPLLAGASLEASLKAVAMLVILGASLAAYRLAREFLGGPAALVAAAAWTYAPYHLLDFFVRTAFSELTVFVFLPLAALAFHRLAADPGPGRVAAAAAALGALALSHTITTMLLPPLLAAGLSALAWRERFRIRTLGALAAAAALGIGLAAFFLVPLVAERDAVETSIYAAGYFDYRKHFVGFGQLVHSPWGYGLSREGAADGISFRLGLLHLAGGAAALLGLARWRSLSPGAFGLAAGAAGLAAAGILLATPAGAPIWSLLPPLRFVQFPWRFLLLPAAGLSILCGVAAALYGLGAPGDRAASGRRGAGPGGLGPRRREAWLPALLVAGIFLASSLPMFGFRERVPMARIGFGGDHTDMRIRSEEDAAREPTVLTRGFVRKETLHWFDHLPPGGYPYPPATDLERPRAEVVSGRAAIEIRSEEPVRYRLGVDADSPCVVRLNVHRFPGWVVRVDGREVAQAPIAGRRPVVAVEIPAGVHEVEARFERSAPRMAGDVASLASLAVLIGLAVTGAAGRRRQAG